jgi:hypothetical protein
MRVCNRVLLFDDQIAVMAVYGGTIGSPGIRDTFLAKVATPESGLVACISPQARAGVQHGN